MKHIFIIIITFCLSATLLAQKSDTPEMLYWNGGNLEMRIDLGFNAFGLGGSASSFAGIVSPSLKNGSGSIFTNPAELGLLKNPQMQFDSRFGISNSTIGLAKDDIISASSIKDGTDSFLEDTTTFIFSKKNFRSDTKVNKVELGLKGGLSNFSFAIPITNNISAGIGYTTPVNINFSMLTTGIMTDLKTKKLVGNNYIDIDFKLNSSFLSNISLNMTQLSFGLGGTIIKDEKRELTLGFAVDRYSVVNDIEVNYYSQGLMVLNNSAEYYFNYADDESLNKAKGETNKLFWKAKGNFKTSAVGYKFGGNFFFNDIGSFLRNVKISLLYNYVPKFKLTDRNAFSESYQPKFLKGRVTGEDEDKLDIIIDSIDIAKPNLTVPTNNYFDDHVDLNLPSSLLVGIDAQLGNHLLALNIIKYSNEFSYGFSKYKFGKKADLGIKAGMDFKFPEELSGWNWALLPVRLLFLDFDGLLMQAFQSKTGYSDPHYRIGAGFMMGEGIAEGIGDEKQKKDMLDIMKMPLITGFSLGKQYTILDKLTIGTLVFGFPDMFMRFTITYNM